MGLFDLIFRPKKNKEEQKALDGANGVFKTLTAYKPVFHNWQGSIYESQLIRSAIEARARHIKKLKFEARGSARPSLQSKLRQGPNQWQTWPQFLARTSTILDIHNTAFIVPIRNADMEVTGYYPVLPTKCEIIEYKEDPWVRYKFAHGDIGAVRADECVILTQHQYRNDWFGENNEALRPTLQLVDLNNQGIREAIENGATYRFWGQVGNFTKTEDLRKEQERFSEKNFSGEGGGVLLFPSGYTNIHQMQNAPYTVDADQQKLIAENVYNYFGVNEDVLQNKAYGDSWSAFYEGAVEPFSLALSEGLTRAMYTERERSLGNEVMFTANRLQYLSNADKLAVSAQMADRGIMSRNEIREIWNLPPVDGGDVATIRGEYYLLNGEETGEEQSTNEE